MAKDGDTPCNGCNGKWFLICTGTARTMKRQDGSSGTPCTALRGNEPRTRPVDVHMKFLGAADFTHSPDWKSNMAGNAEGHTTMFFDSRQNQRKVGHRKRFMMNFWQLQATALVCLFVFAYKYSAVYVVWSGDGQPLARPILWTAFLIATGLGQ